MLLIRCRLIAVGILSVPSISGVPELVCALSCLTVFECDLLLAARGQAVRCFFGKSGPKQFSLGMLCEAPSRSWNVLQWSDGAWHHMPLHSVEFSFNLAEGARARVVHLSVRTACM